MVRERLPPGREGRGVQCAEVVVDAPAVGVVEDRRRQAARAKVVGGLQDFLQACTEAQDRDLGTFADDAALADFDRRAARGDGDALGQE